MKGGNIKMKDLTVGDLENILREFPRNTNVHVSCGHCHHGACGDGIIKLKDYTNQSFGFLEIEVNSRTEPDITCSPDKEEFYLAEIQKLKEKLRYQQETLDEYRGALTSICHAVDSVNRQLK